MGMSVQVDMPVTISAEELKELLAERDALRSELRLVKADAISPRSGCGPTAANCLARPARLVMLASLLVQRGEALSTGTLPAQEDVPGTKVAAHTRKKRGRKPLAPNLPREVVRHETARVRALLRQRWSCAGRDRCRDQRAARRDSGTGPRHPAPARQIRLPVLRLGIKVTPRRHASSRVACSPNRRWRDRHRQVPIRHAAVRRPACCAASAATSRPTRSRPAWSAWAWLFSP